jgi:hypothetical protein
LVNRAAGKGCAEAPSGPRGTAPSGAVQGKRSASSIARPVINGIDPLAELQYTCAKRKYDK